ncbi:50S ribosomal protein L10, partial [Candidatus Microgenomates bacterium]|nr:50S ribosomal protein L10 [Candidatus Microgenomates bacterium]
MKKSEKIFLVEDVTARLNDAKSVVLVDLVGLKMSEQAKLRNLLRDSGAKMSVIKNTLLTRALQMSNLKSHFLNLKSSLTGPTALIIAENDELAPLQAIGKFIREFELPKLKVGVLGGQVHDEAALITLSRLPGREVLLSQTLGALSAPLYGIVGTLRANMGKLVYILSTKSEALN